MGTFTREIRRRVLPQSAGELTRSQTEHVKGLTSPGLSGSGWGCKYGRAGFFCQLSLAELNDFGGLTSIVPYPAEALLFLEQQEAKGIYVLCEGEVKLSFASSNGKTLVLRIARPGEVLGLLSALSGNPYEVTASTLRPCQVAFVSRDQFQGLLRRHPNLWQLMAGQLGMQYRSAYQQLCAVGLGVSLLEKVAQFLLTWSANRGASSDGIPFILPLSHEQIGECVGATRESITRTLGEFRNRGLIERSGTTLLIRDRAALACVCERLATPNSHGPRLLRLAGPIGRSRAPRVHDTFAMGGRRKRA